MHFADSDPMGWAVIDHSRPGDRLDRSFDGGATRAGGAQLGLTAALFKVTGDRGLIGTARSVADSTTRTGSFVTGDDGIVHDPGQGASCTDDGSYSKAGLVRGLSELDAATSDPPYRDSLTRQADSAYAHSRDDFDQYSRSRSSSASNGPGSQTAALALMNATY